MTLDRSIAPSYQPFSGFELQKAHSTTLPNGVHLHYLNAGEQPVVRIELIFKAGAWFESKQLVSMLLMKMAGEGTRSKTAHEISEAFAYYGAYIEYTSGVDKIAYTLHCLTKDLNPLLTVLREVVTELCISDENFENKKRIISQSLKVNQEKTSFLASGAIKETLFGKEHPYGKIQSVEKIEAIRLQDLTEFYKNSVVAENLEVYIAGNVEEQQIELVKAFFGGNDFPSQVQDAIPVFVPAGSNGQLIQKEDAIQSSLRIGRLAVNRSHQDYLNLVVLNEIFGGYFGSRLMKNIREEKGLTYGISSHISHFQHASYWVISTDVKKELTETAILEIYKEMQALVEVAVGEEELETVKSYMLGSFVGSINTPFSLMDKFKVIHANNLGYEYFDKYVNAIKNMTSQALMEAAAKYFVQADWKEVVVGGR